MYTPDNVDSKISGQLGRLNDAVESQAKAWNDAQAVLKEMLGDMDDSSAYFTSSERDELRQGILDAMALHDKGSMWKALDAAESSGEDIVSQF